MRSSKLILIWVTFRVYIIWNFFLLASLRKNLFLFIIISIYFFSLLLEFLLFRLCLGCLDLFLLLFVFVILIGLWDVHFVVCLGPIFVFNGHDLISVEHFLDVFIKWPQLLEEYVVHLCPSSRIYPDEVSSPLVLKQSLSQDLFVFHLNELLQGLFVLTRFLIKLSKLFYLLRLLGTQRLRKVVLVSATSSIPSVVKWKDASHSVSVFQGVEDVGVSLVH